MDTLDLISDEYLKGIMKIIEGLNLILKSNGSKASVHLGTLEEQKQILDDIFTHLKNK